MADPLQARRRLEALRRIAAVQAQMVRLAECRLGRAQDAVHGLANKAASLRDYLSGGIPDLGLARAASRTLGGVAEAQATAEVERDRARVALDALRRRGSVLDTAVDEAAGVARRCDEARDLAGTMDAWLAAAATRN